MADKTFSSFIDDKGQLKIAKPYTAQDDGFTLKDDLNLIKRAILDRTAWGSGVRLYKESKLDQFDNEDYNWAADPTIPDYIKASFPEIVYTSNSPQESRLKIETFQQRRKDRERTLFNVTSLASEVLLDPVSIALMSTPIRTVLFGVDRVKSVRRSLYAINAEEMFKQAEDESRSIADAVVIAGVSTVINKLNTKFAQYNTKDKKIDLGEYHRSVHSEIPTSINNNVNVVNKNISDDLIKKEIAKRKKWTLKEHIDNTFLKIKNEYTDLDIVGSPVNRLINTTVSRVLNQKGKGPSKNVMYYPKTGVLHVDVQQITKEWKTGAWKKNHRFFDKKLPKNTFNDVGEWIEFNIRRALIARKITLNTKSKTPGTVRKAQINKYAFEDLENARLVKKSGSTALNDAQIQQAKEMNNYTFNNTLNDVADESLERIPSLWRMDKWGLSALDKLFGKSSRKAKEFILNLTKEDLYLKFNKEKVATPDSVEIIKSVLFTPRLYDAVDNLQTSYIAYIKELTGKEIKYAKQYQLKPLFNSRVKQIDGEIPLTFEKFQLEIYKTINQGMRSDTKGVLNKYVIQASDDIKKNFFEKYANDIKSTGVFLVPFIKRDEYLEGALQIFLKEGKFFDKKTKTNWKLSEIEDAIKLNNKQMKEADGYLKNYLPQLWVRSEIENNFEALVNILIPRMMQLQFNPKKIADVLDEFRVYKTFDPPPSILQKTNEGMSYKLKNAPVSKFLRNRSLILDDITRNKLIAAGFLETDIVKLSTFYHRSMSAEIAMTMKYGDPAGYGWFYKKGDNRFAPGLMQVSEEYDLLIQAAKTDKAKKLLLLERNDVIKRLEDMRDLGKGQFGVADNPNAFISTSIRFTKVFQNLRALTGAAQIVDLGRLVTIGGITKNFGKQFEMYTNGLLKIFNKGVKQGQKAGQIYDLVLPFTRQNIIAGNDIFQNASKGIEGKLHQLSGINFQYIMPMNPATYISKTLASVQTGDDLIEMIMRISKNTARESDVMFLAQKGISVEQAIKMGAKIRLHGVGKFGKETQGYTKITLANADLWDEPKLTFKFHRALNEYIDEMIITPSDGSAPLIANTEIGAAWLQFKKFGIDMHRKVLIKGLQTKDGKLIEDFLALTAMGMLVDAARSPALNQDYGKKDLRAKLLDGAERGGALGIFTDLNRIIESMSNNNLGFRPVLGIGKQYDSSLSNKLGSVGGPSVSMLANMAEILADWGKGKHTHHTARRFRKLVPLNQIWYMDSIMDSGEKVLY